MGLSHTPTPHWSPGASRRTEAVSDQQSFRGVCSHALGEAASPGASEGSLSSIIQLNPTTGKLFTVIYSNCALWI